MENKTNCVEIFLLGLRGLLPYASNFTDKQLEKRIGKEKLLEVSEDVEGYIMSGVNQAPLTRNEKIALTSQTLNCLSRYILKMNVPVTIKTVIENIHLLGHAVEQGFPGYSASGLLKYTIVPASVAAKIMGIESSN